MTDYQPAGHQPVHHQPVGYPAPQQVFVPPPDRRVRRPVAVALVVAAVLLLGATGTFAALFFAESNRHDETVSRTTEVQRMVLDREKEIAAARKSTADAVKARNEARTLHTRRVNCVAAAKALAGGIADPAARGAEVDKLVEFC